MAAQLGKAGGSAKSRAKTPPCGRTASSAGDRRKVTTLPLTWHD